MTTDPPLPFELLGAALVVSLTLGPSRARRRSEPIIKLAWDLPLLSSAGPLARAGAAQSVWSGLGAFG